MIYTVKTRNWNGNKFVAMALNSIAKITKTSAYKSEDHDNKYYLETNNPARAWATWILFMALKRLSGGWTYIVCGNCTSDGNYKAIYR
jgi:hypothetical protein